jgi:hypothetical protein
MDRIRSLFDLASLFFRLSPVGTAEIGRDVILDNLQPSLRDLNHVHDVPRTGVLGNPGLASWAKFSRPCGTKFVDPVPTHALKPRNLLSLCDPT